MKPYVELSSSAQNAYADLFSSAVASSLVTGSAGLNGSFGKKRVSNHNYWYFQYRGLDGKVEQVYVGPESERLERLIQNHSLRVTKPLQQLSAAAVALGCESMLPKHFRVMRRIAEYGFFKRGGILVGTHAFMTMANMLGIAPAERMQTQDIDFAHAGKNISIALPSTIKVETEKAIESLEMGLLPISTLEGKFGATYLNPADPAFRLDFLTSKNSTSDEPVFIDGLSIALQPLKFMEFSMIDVAQAVVVANEGAVIVNIPKPDRFAIHKLIVSAERNVSESAKINKDVRQANVLIQYYLDFREPEILQTCKDAYGRGLGWKKRLLAGIDRLEKLNPPAAAALRRMKPTRSSRSS
jgi:hypothetical protein